MITGDPNTVCIKVTAVIPVEVNVEGGVRFLAIVTRGIVDTIDPETACINATGNIHVEDRGRGGVRSLVLVTSGG
jgi:hypothetical protein